MWQRRQCQLRMRRRWEAAWPRSWSRSTRGSPPSPSALPSAPASMSSAPLRARSTQMCAPHLCPSIQPDTDTDPAFAGVVPFIILGTFTVNIVTHNSPGSVAGTAECAEGLPVPGEAGPCAESAHHARYCTAVQPGPGVLPLSGRPPSSIPGQIQASGGWRFLWLGLSQLLFYISQHCCSGHCKGTLCRAGCL